MSRLVHSLTWADAAGKASVTFNFQLISSGSANPHGLRGLTLPARVAG
jgi:hypothetical protein